MAGEGAGGRGSVPPRGPRTHLGCTAAPGGTARGWRGRRRTRGRGRRDGAAAPQGRWWGGTRSAGTGLGWRRGVRAVGAPGRRSRGARGGHPPISRVAGAVAGSAAQGWPPSRGGRQCRWRTTTPSQPPVQLDQVAHSLQAPSTAGRGRGEGRRPPPGNPRFGTPPPQPPPRQPWLWEPRWAHQAAPKSPGQPRSWGLPKFLGQLQPWEAPSQAVLAVGPPQIPCAAPALGTPRVSPAATDMGTPRPPGHPRPREPPDPPGTPATGTPQPPHPTRSPWPTHRDRRC